MRVTHIITRLIVGGAQENTVASVLGLQRKPGLQLSLLSGPTTGPEGSLEHLFAPHPGLLRLVPELVRPVHPWKDALAWRSLTRVLREQKPQLVHTHSGKAGVLGRLAAARAGVPLIVHTIHGPSFGPFQGAVSNRLFRLAEQRAARVTTHFVVVADAMRKQYLRAGIGLPEQYTRIVSGFTLEPFLDTKNDPALRRSLGLAPDDIIIGKIARLAPLKGHDDLLQIAPGIIRVLPKAKFLLVGGGPRRPQLEATIRQLGLTEHFVLTGLVPPEKVPALIGIMDLLVHLSAREGLARALPQALTAGRPVVAYDADGAAEACLENQTGFLVAPGDLSTLSERLLQLGRDPQLRARFGAQGREFVRARFDVQTMVDSLYALYLRLAAEAQPGQAQHLVGHSALNP